MVGQFVDEARARMETAAQGNFVNAPITIVIGSYPRQRRKSAKTEIARRLHEMVDERLFGTNLGRWKKSTEAVSTLYAWSNEKLSGRVRAESVTYCLPTRTDLRHVTRLPE